MSEHADRNPFCYSLSLAFISIKAQSLRRTHLPIYFRLGLWGMFLSPLFSFIYVVWYRVSCFTDLINPGSISFANPKFLTFKLFLSKHPPFFFVKQSWYACSLCGSGYVYSHDFFFERALGLDSRFLLQFDFKKFEIIGHLFVFPNIWCFVGIYVFLYPDPASRMASYFGCVFYLKSLKASSRIKALLFDMLFLFFF